MEIPAMTTLTPMMLRLATSIRTSPAKCCGFSVLDAHIAAFDAAGISHEDAGQ
jgi:hypothetical protein